MALVLVEAPFAATNGRTVAQNVHYCRRAMRDCLMRGEAPFASHALYTLPGVLDDSIGMERALGIKAGLEWGSMAHRTAVYVDHGISPGMRLGIDAARAVGRPVEFRSLRVKRVCQVCGGLTVQGGCVVCSDGA